MIALVLQLVGLIGLPVGGAIIAGPGGLVAGASVSAIYVGIALEQVSE